MDSNKLPGGKLNPFALPTETDARFILLVLSAPALAFGVSELLRYSLNPDASTPFSGVPSAPGDLPLDEYFLEQAKFGYELMRASIASLALPALLIGIIFLAAAVLYRDHPRRLQRKKDALPYVARTDLVLEGELSALTSRSGLPVVPHILLGKTLGSQDGQAFGVGRRKSIYLGGGLRLLLRKSADRFRAILLHELAHIVNRDIGRTYFAQSLWSAVVLVTILPLVGSTLYLATSSSFVRLSDGLSADDLQEILFVKLPSLAGILFRSAGLIVVVLMVRAGLLRTRELYADWRAALWGSGSTLAAILQAQTRGRKVTGLPAFRLHPSPAERLDTLNKPRRLFDVHYDVPLVAGIFTGLILDGLIPIAISAILSVVPGLSAFTSLWIDRAYRAADDSVLLLLPVFYLLNFIFWGLTLLMALSPFLIQAPLLAATIGLQVQRQTLADLAEGRRNLIRYLQLAVPAGWMGLGILAGVLLSPVSVLAPRSASHVFGAFLFLLVFVFFLWLVLVYARFFSSRLLGSHAKQTPPRGKYRFLTVLLSILFLLVETPLVIGYMFVLNAPALGLLETFLLVTGLSVGMLVLFVMTFLASWVLYLIYRRLRPVRCPSCGRTASLDIPIGKNCPKCGLALTPWLFTIDSPGQGL